MANLSMFSHNDPTTSNLPCGRSDATGSDLWLMQLLLWSIAVVAVLRLAWMVLEWWMDVVVATDKHFMITFGVITRKTSGSGSPRRPDRPRPAPIPGPGRGAVQSGGPPMRAPQPTGVHRR